MLSLTKQKLMATKLDELKIETERLEMVYKRKLEALDELKQAVLSSAFSGGL
jgi:type I restriction enzyme S subunit